MASAFPSGQDTWTTKTDNVDTVFAADVNNIQNAVASLEIGGVSTQAIAYAASITPNVPTGQYIIVGALTGNITINAPTNPTKGRRLTFRFIQDGTGGRTVTWNAVFLVTNWAVNLNANALTEATFTYDGTNWILAVNPPVMPLSAGTQAGTRNNPTATSLWRLNPPADDTLHGPDQMFTHGALFQNVWCRSLYEGYNVGDGGAVQASTDNGFYLAWEPDYDDGAKRTDEFHLDWVRGSAEVRTDGVTTSGSPTVTSATGGFTNVAGAGADAGRWYVGRSISGTGIPASTYIGVVNSATSIGLSSSATSNVPVNATATNSGVTLTITGLSTTVAQYRPIFIQVNKATGAVHFELNCDSGISFNDVRGAQPNWGTLGPTGLSITPPAGTVGNNSIVLGWIAGQQNALQIGNSTNTFLLQPTAAGGATWSFGIGANTLCLVLSANQLDMTQGTGNGAFIAGNGGGFQIQNNAKNANWEALRNISDEFYIGRNSSYTGISFQAGGATAFRLGPTPSVGFYGTAPVAKATVSGAKGGNAALGSLMTALAGLGLVTDSTTA